MKSIQHLILCILVTNIGHAQTSVPSPEDQIGAAVMAVPEDQRSGAGVVGYNNQYEIIILRKATNDLICLTDDPNQAGFSVACYHKDLEPFMARGRQLRTDGKNRKESFDIREQEVQEGKLKMPEQPTTLHILSGAKGKYNPQTGEVTEANYRYVVYIPYATPESTGLPIRPIVPGGPWIMDPGTHRAHIMITPPKQN